MGAQNHPMTLGLVPSQSHLVIQPNILEMALQESSKLINGIRANFNSTGPVASDPLLLAQPAALSSEESNLAANSG